MKKVIVINNPEKWSFNTPDVEVISPKQYLQDATYGSRKSLRIFNLSNDYSYQKRGYYVSLLAEARGHKVTPSVKDIIDLKSQAIVKIVSDDLDKIIQKSLDQIKSNEYTLSIYFGHNLAAQHERLSKELYKLFRAPFLRAKFVWGTDKWEVQSIRPIAFKDIPEHHLDYVEQFASEYFGKKRYDFSKPEKYLYDFAILVDPAEKSSPSNKKALAKFQEVAEKLGCYVDFITKDDYNKIGEYDMLLIRATTSVNHYTYRMARRAESEGLVVIDSPESILKCANKVFLAELLNAAKVPTPKTVIVTSEKDKAIETVIGFPCVLKLPDSSFSQGVKKVHDKEQLRQQLKSMFKQSDLIIAQEFVPTDYDWRIGVLNNKVLFACRYFMAKNHWQIYNWDSGNEDDTSGNFDNIPVEDAPKHIIETSLKATKLIGDGLYGVDIKDINGKGIVIEINDNPNIDYGIEDLLLKDKLYHEVIQYMISKIKRPDQHV